MRQQQRGRKADTSSSGSEIFTHIPSVLKQTESSKLKGQEKNDKKPKSLSKKKKDQESKGNLKKAEVKLTKKMKEYETQIKDLRQQIQDEQENQKYIETFNSTKDQYEKLIQTYEETIQQLKQTELNLLEELQGQSEIARDALNKLYQFQQEYNVERDQLKQYYEDYFKDKEQEIIKKYQIQIHQIENQMLESQNHEPRIVQEFQKKLKDMATKEELYLEEIETLKNKLTEKKQPIKEKVQKFKFIQELRQKLIDMELKLQEWDDNLERCKNLEQDNYNFKNRIIQLEKQLSRKEEKEKRLKDEWSKQYLDLQTEIRYWKNEMDKVIMENNLVLSKITPSKKKY